jgi:hypothetical protein
MIRLIDPLFGSFAMRELKTITYRSVASREGFLPRDASGGFRSIAQPLLIGPQPLGLLGLVS